jgi:hypothetical protein
MAVDLRVNFSLSIDREDPSVSLLLANSDPMGMWRVPAGSQFVYEIAVRFTNVSKFPFSQSYNYARRGAICFPSERTLIVHSLPELACINVSDDLTDRERPADMFTVSFNISYRARENEFVAVQTDFSAFVPPTPSYLLLQRVPDQPLWTGRALVPLFAPRPIVYKYTVFSGEKVVHRESGRAHVLFLGDASGGLAVSVYDSWWDGAIGFPYVPRPICAARGRKSEPIFMVDFVAPTRRRKAFLAGSMPSMANVEPLFEDGAWRFDRAIPAGETRFTFKIGTSDLPSGDELQWAEPYCFQIHEASRPSAIFGRFIFGPQTQKVMSVYVPLISLHSANQPMGDFHTLVDFAGWAKQVGIGQIHICFEMLKGHLLDPVHAAIDCDVGELTIPAVRDSKLRQLQQLFESSSGNDPRFREFCDVFNWMRPYCSSEFAYWVQFYLFNQLGAAYAKILELGVQLVVDFSAGAELNGMFMPLQMMSHYAQVIRLIGMDTFCQPVRREVIESLFGPDSDFVIRTFCIETGGVLTIPNGNRQPEYVEQVLSHVTDLALRQELESRVSHLMLLARNVLARRCRDFLQVIAPYLPSAVILDAAASKFFDPRVVHETFGMIPSASDRELNPAVPTALMPSFMSPEMVSEFLPNIPSDQIHAQFTERIRSNALSVTVYLADFIAAIGGFERYQPAPIQLIAGHCRFVMPVAIDQMKANEAVNLRIREFLHGAERAV